MNYYWSDVHNESVNNFGSFDFQKKLFGTSVKNALTIVCTTPPVKDRILAISVRDDTCMGFTRAEQTFISVRAKNEYS